MEKIASAKATKKPSPFDWIDWIRDPVPDFGWWLQDLEKDQRQVIMGKQIDQRISTIQFAITYLKAEIDILTTMKPSMKNKG